MVEESRVDIRNALGVMECSLASIIMSYVSLPKQPNQVESRRPFCAQKCVFFVRSDL